MKHFLAFLLVPLISFTSTSYQNSGFVENFTLPNVTDGQEFSLQAYKEVPTVVVIFTSLSCPYSQLYEARINELISDFQSENIRFILINPNNPKSSPKDSMKDMVRVAQEKQWQVPFLIDQNQRVARMFGAKKTPEAFVLSRQRKSFQIVYQGAIDDNPQVARDVHHAYLRDFLKASEAGKPHSLHTTPATGCIIRR